MNETTETAIIKKIAEIEEKMLLVTELRQKVQIIAICVVGLAVITLAMIIF